MRDLIDRLDEIIRYVFDEIKREDEQPKLNPSSQNFKRAFERFLDKFTGNITPTANPKSTPNPPKRKSNEKGKKDKK
jgi:hypothetical protein